MDGAHPTIQAPGPVVLGGRYEVDQLLGRGGMGEVFAGLDRRLERAVAIKLLRSDMAHQPAVRDRFEDEARLAARLVHPHVVAVFDTGEEEGRPYLIMERLSGRTLADELRAGPLPIDTVSAIGLQILDALGAAHSAGLVHRDVKPANVMLAGPGCWKVGDFGIAKSLEAADPGHTMAGVIIGTPAYLAPERLAGHPATASSDIYAAGVVLYEALTGNKPVPDGMPLLAVPAAAPIPVRELRPDAPASLVAVVDKAMQPDPLHRFSTAAEMASALRTLGAPSDDATVALPVIGPAIASAPTLTQQPVASWTEEATPPVSWWTDFTADRPHVGLALAAAGALVVIVVALLLGAHHSPTRTTPPPAAGPSSPAAGPGSPSGSSTSPVGGSIPAPLGSALQRLQQAVRP